MTKRTRRLPEPTEPLAGDVPLPGMESERPFRIPPGAAERAVAHSVAAAVAAGRLDVDEHAAAIRAAASVARIVDRLTPSQTTTVTPYAGAMAVQASRELAAQLRELGLVPGDRSGVDPLDAMLAGIGGVSTT